MKLNDVILIGGAIEKIAERTDTTISSVEAVIELIHAAIKEAEGTPAPETKV